MDRRLYISFLTLRAVLRWRSHSVICSWRPSGSADENKVRILSSRVRRHGTSYRAPSAALHPWTVSRRLWKHFCLRLISDCTLHFYCCMQRIFSISLWVCTASLNRSPCYGALEIVVTLLLFLFYYFLRRWRTRIIGRRFHRFPFPDRLVSEDSVRSCWLFETINPAS